MHIVEPKEEDEESDYGQYETSIPNSRCGLLVV
jgi:hypothetical protein